MVLAAVLAGLFCAHPASAQNITKLYGDGQLVRPFQLFAPMTVQVTDSNGVPQINVAVNWAITSASINAVLLSGSTTYTLGDGTSSNVFAYSTFQTVGNVNKSMVAASTTNASVTFNLTESLAATNNSLAPAVNVTSLGNLPSMIAGQALTGQAGSTGSTPIQVSIWTSTGGSVPNVSMQLVNYQSPFSGPTVNCAGAAGGEANTVMSDQTGVATCTPVFGPVPGTGQFYILVGAGGITPADPTAPPFANWAIGPLNLSVTAAQPGLIRVTQGNGQSAAPGQPLAAALQVEVDTASGTPVAGQTVNWTVTPAGAASLSSTTSSTDANGRAAVTATFSGTASGGVQIAATCPACPAGARSVSFSVTAVPIVTLSGVQIVSGNNQSAIVNTVFGLPLVVQVNASNGQGAANVGVQFSVTGPASLSSSTVNTDANGRAQVSVTAGGTAGAVTVTATVGGYTQSFSLTVSPAVPPGPTLTASSFYNGADFKAGSISPCSIATIIAPGLAPGIQGVVTPGSLFGPLPYLLASDAVSFNGTAAPIFNVANVGGQEQITVQVPCEVTPSSAVSVAVTVGAAPPVTVSVPVLAASPGIFETTMSDGVLRAVAVRPDGSWVSLINPARRGETIRVYATGLGVTSPSVGTDATAIPGVDAVVQGNLIMGVTNTAGQGEGVRVSTARVAPDLIGVMEIPFEVPMDAATGNNVSFSIGVIPVGSSTPIYSVTAKLPIQ
jgi:uncharacterized protein (TIGR03437 family)